MILDRYQLQQLKKICDGLELPRNASGEDIARELQLYLNIAPEKAQLVGQKILQGMALARDFCAGEFPGDVSAVMERATKGMNPEEVRGFCLMIYSALREGDGIPTAAPDTHLVLHRSDEEIRDITARDLELHGRDILTRAEVYPGFGCDGVTLSTAMYIFCAQGALPDTLSEAPELLGICCGAAEQLSAAPPSEDAGKALVVLVAVVMTLVMLAAAGPAFAAWSESLVSIATGAGLTASVEAGVLSAIGTFEQLGPVLMGTFAYRTSFDSTNEFREFYNDVAADQHKTAVARAKDILDVWQNTDADA